MGFLFDSVLWEIRLGLFDVTLDQLIDVLFRVSLERGLWIVAIALFDVGNLVMTVYCIVEFGAVETHLIGGPAIDALGF